MQSTRSASTCEPQASDGDALWVLFDTETTGLNAPIFVVELAAQRMRGWQPEGEAFRKLLNQNKDIPAAASRVHGYTREILERDGEPAQQAYRAFADYVGKLPLVAFNLEYDLTEVLEPEWGRLCIAPIGRPGLCALRLAQRLLDPVPAGNCKLQTLRQYYRLPERGAHTALGDVQTVADLFAQVLRPVAELRGLDSWDKLVAYAAEEWFPSRIAFGKHKGRLVQEARQDAELRRWLDWLAGSTNARSATMGRWYLRQLAARSETGTNATVIATRETAIAGNADQISPATEFAGLVIYLNPELERLRELVSGARARLAELEVSFVMEKSRVVAMQAVLFRQLCEHYQRRDRLRLILNYRKQYLDLLMHGGEEEAHQAEKSYEEAKAQSNADYEETAAAVAGQKEMTATEEEELGRLWKKLVKLYHPDRFAHEPDKQATYEKLTSAINHAKDNGDITRLKEIADDPHGFILRQGWTSLDLNDDAELEQLRRLHEALQLEIFTAIESLERLLESPDYELCRLSEKEPGRLDALAKERAKVLAKESAGLEDQAARLAKEITELTGQVVSRIE